MKRKSIIAIVALTALFLVMVYAVSSANMTANAVWASNWCTWRHRCPAGEGDCDRNTDCLTGYCASNVGLKYNKSRSMDVCECVSGRVWNKNSSKCELPCTSKTCTGLGYNCGTASNGCGGTLNCGACPSGYVCSSGHCVYSGGNATANRAPVITSTPIKTVNEGLQYQYDVNANDSDGDAITYSLATKPGWLSINSATGLISGVAPQVTQDTVIVIGVRASDGKLTASQNYNMTVKNVASNSTASNSTG